MDSNVQTVRTFKKLKPIAEIQKLHTIPAISIKLSSSNISKWPTQVFAYYTSSSWLPIQHFWLPWWIFEPTSIDQTSPKQCTEAVIQIY